MLLLKDHVRELHDLDTDAQQAQFHELMIAGAAVEATFQPWKMNYACYGNAEQHVHWHIFPRYDTEPDNTRNPWLHTDQFKEHRIMDDQAREWAMLVKSNLQS